MAAIAVSGSVDAEDVCVAGDDAPVHVSVTGPVWWNVRVAAAHAVARGPAAAHASQPLLELLQHGLNALVHLG